jgi:hypothetical protein
LGGYRRRAWDCHLSKIEMILDISKVTKTIMKVIVKYFNVELAMSIATLQSSGSNPDDVMHHCTILSASPQFAFVDQYYTSKSSSGILEHH